MRHTFRCDEGMLITIPLGTLKDGQQGELMPDQFHCVFRDVYKVFITKGKPKRVGVCIYCFYSNKHKLYVRFIEAL